MMEQRRAIKREGKESDDGIQDGNKKRGKVESDDGIEENIKKRAKIRKEIIKQQNLYQWMRNKGENNSK